MKALTNKVKSAYSMAKRFVKSCKKGVEQTEYVDLGVGGWAAIGAVALSVVIGDVFMILPVVPAWW